MSWEVLLLLYFLEDTGKIDVISSLNICYNSPVKSSVPRVFILARFIKSELNFFNRDRVVQIVYFMLGVFWQCIDIQVYISVLVLVFAEYLVQRQTFPYVTIINFGQDIRNNYPKSLLSNQKVDKGRRDYTVCTRSIHCMFQPV